MCRTYYGEWACGHHTPAAVSFCVTRAVRKVTKALHPESKKYLTCPEASSKQHFTLEDPCPACGAYGNPKFGTHPVGTLFRERARRLFDALRDSGDANADMFRIYCNREFLDEFPQHAAEELEVRWTLLTQHDWKGAVERTYRVLAAWAADRQGEAEGSSSSPERHKKRKEGLKVHWQEPLAQVTVYTTEKSRSSSPEKKPLLLEYAKLVDVPSGEGRETEAPPGELLSVADEIDGDSEEFAAWLDALLWDDDDEDP